MLTFNNLEQKLRKNKIFELFGLQQLGVFGSFARGENFNDIDFLLEEDMNFADRALLKKKLTSILKTKVDIVPSKFADPIILNRAQKDLKYVYR